MHLSIGVITYISVLRSIDKDSLDCWQRQFELSEQIPNIQPGMLLDDGQTTSC